MREGLDVYINTKVRKEKSLGLDCVLVLGFAVWLVVFFFVWYRDVFLGA